MLSVKLMPEVMSVVANNNRKRGDEMKEKVKQQRSEMMNPPNIICSKIDELNKMVEQYPEKIPVEKAAKFLGIDKDVLRRILSSGKCPFGFGIEAPGAYRRGVSCIPTTVFYLWITKQ